MRLPIIASLIILGFVFPSEAEAQAQPPYVFASAGTDQFTLSVGSNTKLTVPVGTLCAAITIESFQVRRTSDGSTATATNGTLMQPGTQWQDCGPLATYNFTAVSGSPKLDVEYFK